MRASAFFRGLYAAGPRVHDARMGDTYKPRTMGLVWIATFVTLVVTVVRVVGEFQGWDPRWFSSEAGSPGGWFGIVWLVPAFGFLFGRRLAQAGSRTPFVAAFFVPMFAWLALVAAAMYLVTSFEGEALREHGLYLLWGGPVLALLALFAWPRAFLTNLTYAAMARIPVVVVQILDVQNGWQTHYGKLHPKLPPMGVDERMWLLAMLQCSFWLPFTVLLAGGCAAIGAATVRKA